jgi:hypothetical protein
MRFMLMRKSDQRTETGEMPTEDMLAATGQYMEAMMKAGVLLGGEGLRPTSEAKRVAINGGRPIITDGPFAETKEQLAGYCLIRVNSFEEALEWAKKWPAIDDAVIEIRRLYEEADFGEEFTPELRANEARMRAELEGKA